MTSLKDYDLIVNDVFYRGHHILDWIKNNPNMSDLDREAIKATIMDALVYKKLIDPEKQSLDLENLCICDDTKHYCYDKQPFVTSIPLDIKEKMRSKCLVISGGIPASVFYAKPGGGVSFCIYDMNTVFSTFFEDFTFILCNYESPTRKGKIAKDRPFIEVLINDTKYLVDALTKRIFRSDLFKEKYKLEVIESVSKEQFDKKKRQFYKEQTMEYNNYAQYIEMTKWLPLEKISNMTEMIYEIEKSKELFPEEFERAELLDEERKRYFKINNL